ncbi:hypothetical protein NEMBOFW57_008120 [Staphylotrichum longicolle]|uniref:U1-C C2H2-type zinc finger domain-containing protein n=1 Tax=Staphylotrichum longicolle TaxID=669026 RepID=A0AAD4HWC0_9PEZI|nr:hypothetical protein NEMBOFW57_008120 [Staphylotrichum longicolle]
MTQFRAASQYWCKHCSTFVRDTKLERANHEATGKHQGAVKRALRDLHRNADQKERDKDRAKREVDRLNGVVAGTSAGASSASRLGAKPTGGAHAGPSQEASQADRQKQLEQLAELGVNIPTELRRDMAMAGEWTVTATRVIDSSERSEDKDAAAAEGRATGVKRERERTEEEKEQEDAIKGLFKRRKWGVDSKTMPADEDAELEALLSGPLVKPKKEEPEPPVVKTEDGQEETVQGDVAEAAKQEPVPLIKKEPDEEDTGLGASEARESGLKTTSGVEGAERTEDGQPGAAVVFKKRKPKNIRQK